MNKYNHNKNTLALMAHVLRLYPLRSVIVLLGQMLAGLLECMGIAVLVPLLAILFQMDGEKSLLAEKIESAFLFVGLTPSLPLLLVVLILAFVVKAALMFVSSIQIGYASAYVANDLRLKFIQSLMGAKWSYFVSNASGKLAFGLTSEAEMASTNYVTTCQLLAALFHLSVYAATACLMSWKVTLMAVAAGGAASMLLGGFIHMARSAGIRQTELLNIICGRFVDGLQGIKTLKAMGNEDRLGPMLQNETNAIMAAQRQHVVSKLGLTTLQEPLVVVMLSVGLYMARDDIATNFEIATALIFLFWRMTMSIHKLQQYYQKIARSEKAWHSLNEKINGGLEVKESYSGAQVAELAKGIDISGVTFSYPGNTVLREVDLSIGKGQFVAVAGQSGIGKTTLIDLIVGLITPDKGEVLVDGVSLADMDIKKWRNMIGYVQQEVTLFHDTIMHNVTLGEESIDRQSVEKALKASGAWSFVQRCTNGVDTVVGERGGKLSGGQRQRLAIARALVREPKLLLLDEVTSALDPATEKEICEIVASLKGDVTIVAISHQKGITQYADKVYELEGGNLKLNRGTE